MTSLPPCCPCSIDAVAGCSKPRPPGRARVRTSCGTFLSRDRDKIVKVVEKRIANFAFIPWRKAGETPTAATLFAKAHVRAKDKTFPDDRSKVVWEKYQSLKLAKQVPTSQEDDGLFLEAAGGWTVKGTVYGLGNAAEFFYNRPTAGTCSGKPSYTPSIVSQLQTELDSTKAELNSTKNELQQQRESVEEQRNQLEKQQKMMEEQREMLLAMQAQLKLMSQRQEPSI